MAQDIEATFGLVRVNIVLGILGAFGNASNVVWWNLCVIYLLLPQAEHKGPLAWRHNLTVKI